MTQTVQTSVTLVNSYQSTWRSKPEGSHPHTQRREKRKSYLIITVPYLQPITISVGCLMPFCTMHSVSNNAKENNHAHELEQAQTSHFYRHTKPVNAQITDTSNSDTSVGFFEITWPNISENSCSECMFLIFHNFIISIDKTYFNDM
jgi:hypothetical protein